MYVEDTISENMSLLNTSSRKVDHTKSGALADVKSSWFNSQNSTRKAIMQRNGVCEQQDKGLRRERTNCDLNMIATPLHQQWTLGWQIPVQSSGTAMKWGNACFPDNETKIVNSEKPAFVCMAML